MRSKALVSLNNKVVAFLESRMSSEMGSLIERHGGVPYSAPAMQELYLKDSPDVQELIVDICRGRLDVMVLLTGVGTRAMLEVADEMGFKDELIGSFEEMTVIARSPKPARVLRQNKIRIDVMPSEPYTSEDLLESIKDLGLYNKTVAVQHYGGPNGTLINNLKSMGANVREVTLYRWGLPEDESPILSMIDEISADRIDAVAFTSQPQVGNLVAIAAKAGKEQVLRDGLAGRVLLASVGPVCTRKLKELGFNVDVEPDHPHMGSLVVAMAEYLSED